MGNLAKLGADYTKCNYIKMANEILFVEREVNGKKQKISPMAKSVFLTVMNLPKDWDITEKGMATIMDTSEYAIRKAFKELKDWGYLEYKMMKDSFGKYTERLYVFKEVINSPIDVNRCTFPAWMDSTRMESHEVEFQADGFHSDGNLSQYNNIINNNINNKDLSLKNNINKNTNSEEFEQENSRQENNKHVSHVSNELTTTSFSKNLKITKQDWAALDKNHDKTIADIMNVKDPKNEPKQTRRQKKQEEVKNLVQQMENEKGDTISTLDTQIVHTMNDLTKEDNELSRAMGAAKELLELNKAVNKSNLQKLSNIKQMQKEADRLIDDGEIAKWFKEYLDVKIHKTGLMAKPTVGLLYEDLKSKACDNKQTMVILLKEAIRLGWNDFYVSDGVQKQVEGLKQVQQINNIEPNEDDEYVEVLDENGNPIQF